MIDKELADLLADRIKICAVRKGTSVSQALKACGLNKDFVAQMVRRGSIPSAKAFILLADYFDVPADFILGRTDDMSWY